MAVEKRRDCDSKEDDQLTHKICAMFTREFFGGGKENSFHKFLPKRKQKIS